MSTEPKPEPSDLQRLAAIFNQHMRCCWVCGAGTQQLCEMGEALMTGLSKAAIKESK